VFHRRCEHKSEALGDTSFLGACTEVVERVVRVVAIWRHPSVELETRSVHGVQEGGEVVAEDQFIDFFNFKLIKLSLKVLKK
jgi:hypothetical protein